MAKTSVYQATGFFLLSQLETSGLKYYTAATVTIVKGDVMTDNGSGLATNGTTDLSGLFLGVAAIGVTGDSSSVVVSVIPPLPQYQFIVAIGANAVIAQTDVTSHFDLSAVNTLAINDALTEGWVFTVDEIDIGTEAIAANTYGYAIGHFQSLGTQA